MDIIGILHKLNPLKCYFLQCSVLSLKRLCLTIKYYSFHHYEPEDQIHRHLNLYLNWYQQK